MATTGATGTWEWDIATGTVAWSQPLYEIYGVPPQTPITFELFLSFLVPEERPRIQHAIEVALMERGKFAYREMIKRGDGELRTLDTKGGVVTDADNNVVKLVGTCRDITDDIRRDARVRFYDDVFASVQIGLSAWQVDRREGAPRVRLIAFNPAFERLSGQPLTAKLGQKMIEVFPDIDRDLLERARATVESTPIYHAPPLHLNALTTVSPTVFPLPGGHVGMSFEDITAQYRNDIITNAERRALEMLAGGGEIRAILDEIVRAIDAVSPGAISSILIVDETGKAVRHGAASPELSQAYCTAIDGAPVGPKTGSCGTAAYRRQTVIVTDIETDPLWDDYRELARSERVRACWSQPIFSNEGRVLGTFAIYHRVPCAPDEAARELMTRASHVTRIVLERRALDEQLRALAGRLELAREDERTSIARDIHDQLGQSLTVLKLDLGWLGRRITDEALRGKLDEMGKTTDEVIRTVRRIAADLRPGILDDIGLAAAIEWAAEEFQKTARAKVTVRAEIGDIRLERTLATAVFRIFQESLTNIARHAKATDVQISLTLEAGNLRMEIADDGIGVPDVWPRTTLGILGMGERARRLGGECTVRRRAPHGTLVTLVTPLRFPSEAGKSVG